jgi:hypothetical protein
MTAIGFWQCGQQVICGASWYDIALPTRYVWVWLRQAAIVAVKRPHRSAKSISVSRHLAGRPICFAPHPSYLDQFCLSVLSAWFSSARHASLFRPRSTAPRPAASQLGPTCRTGGPPPPPRPCAVRDCDRDGFWGCVCRCVCVCGSGLPSGLGSSSFCTAGGRSPSVGWRCRQELGARCESEERKANRRAAHDGSPQLHHRASSSAAILAQ